MAGYSGPAGGKGQAPFPGMFMPPMGMQAPFMFGGMFPGQMGKGCMPFPGFGGFEAKGKGKKGFDKGKGKGFGKDKGKGKGYGEPRQERPPNPILDAQRDARQRFEKDILDKIQGRWVDEADDQISYTLEGNIVSVQKADGSRGFRNRLSVYGVDMCWDARRFWHYLNTKELFAAGEAGAIEKVEWNPGKDSPPTEKIVWLKVPNLPEGEPAVVGEQKEEEAAAPAGEAVPAEEAEAPADGAIAL